jgi:hypothetical protein
MTPDKDDDVARSRFLILQAVRFGGLTMALLGFAALYGRLPFPEPVAYVLILIGVVDAFFLPTFLARRWRSQGE